MGNKVMKMQSERRKANEIAVLLAILVVIATIVGFVAQKDKVMHPHSTMYDTKYIEALESIAKDLPEDAVLVSSDSSPRIVYFTGHMTHVPWRAQSKESMMNFMESVNGTHLLIFENSSYLPSLKSIFNSKGIKSLEDNFESVGTYKTDFFKIHLYKLVERER